MSDGFHCSPVPCYLERATREYISSTNESHWKRFLCLRRCCDGECNEYCVSISRGETSLPEGASKQTILGLFLLPSKTRIRHTNPDYPPPDIFPNHLLQDGVHYHSCLVLSFLSQSAASRYGHIRIWLCLINCHQ